MTNNQTNANLPNQQAPTPSAKVSQPLTMQPTPPAQQTPPTPPAKQKRKPNRLPLILSGMLIVNLLLVVLILLWASHKKNMRHKAQYQIARRSFQVAEEYYDKGDYENAEDLFNKIAKGWPTKSELNRKSQAYSRLAQGREHIAQKNYIAALTVFHAVKQMDVFTDARRYELQQLINQIQSAADLQTKKQTIQKLIDNQQFDLARQKISRYQRQAKGENTLALDDLAMKINNEEQRIRVQVVLRQAKKMASNGKSSDAIKHLEKAYATYPSAAIQKLLQTLRDDFTYTFALKQADQYLEKNLTAKAIDALKKAQAIRPTPEIEKKLNKQLSFIEFEQGDNAEQTGDFSQAIVHYHLSIKYLDNKFAKEALLRLKSADQVNMAVKAGDKAMLSNDFDAAIQSYQKALKLVKTKIVQQKLTIAIAKRHIQKGMILLDQNQIAQAQEIFNEVQKIPSTDASFTQMLMTFQQRFEYQKFVSQGDRYRQSQKFGQAKRSYRKAKGIANTLQIKQRLTVVESEHLVSQSQRYIASENWISARSLLLQANKIHPTARTAKLLKSVESNLPADELLAR